MSRIKKTLSPSSLKICTVEATPNSQSGRRPADANRSGLVLSSLEECVIRMRQGLALAPDDALEYKGQNNPETRAKLAFIEQEAMHVMEQRASDVRRKSRIIEKLKQ